MSQPAHNTEPVEKPQDDVNDALTAASTTASGSTRTPARRSPARRRRRGEVENTDYAAFAAGSSGPTRAGSPTATSGLADLLALRDALDTATQTAVIGLRGFGYSWGEIAARLGTTREAAQQRWGR